jgi:hypothetical protein
LTQNVFLHCRIVEILTALNLITIILEFNSLKKQILIMFLKRILIKNKLRRKKYIEYTVTCFFVKINKLLA